MKQKIHILGTATVMLLVVAVIFKINHWPAAGIMLTLGMFSLLLVFLPLALVNNYKNASGERSFLMAVTTWLTGFIMFGSMLFKIMHWPGAGIVLMIALPFPFVVFLPVYLIVTSKIKGFDINNTIYILFLLAAHSVFAALLALNVSRDRIVDATVLIRHYEGAEKIMEKSMEAETISHISPSSEAAMNAADDLLGIIRKNRERIRKTIGSGSSSDSDITDINFLESRSIAEKALTQEGEPVEELRLLNEALGKFMSSLKKVDTSGDMPELAYNIFGINENLRDIPWPDRLVASNYLVWVIADINAMEVNTMIFKEMILAGSIPDKEITE